MAWLASPCLLASALQSSGKGSLRMVHHIALQRITPSASTLPDIPETERKHGDVHEQSRGPPPDTQVPEKADKAGRLFPAGHVRAASVLPDSGLGIPFGVYPAEQVFFFFFSSLNSTH